LYVVGEGIEKKVDDFAAEVAAQVAAAQTQLNCAVGKTRDNRSPFKGWFNAKLQSVST
jgi:hypothetical protein